MNKTYIVIVLLLFCLNCASHKFQNINYSKTNSVSESLNLNVFQPKKTKSNLNPVIIFVHGGNWNAGNKNIYGFLGRNFAKKDIVTVIPSYTLSPNANYDTMASQIAEALKWTTENVENYGGDSNQIYLMGHSAGGHLIALISTNPKYLDNTNSIKGVILNDAAGLDMYSYLQEIPPTTVNNYKTTWTEDPKLWKDASPIYFLTQEIPEFLIYLGKKTYESIKIQNAAFLETLHHFQPNVEPILLNKKHVQMMTQYFWPWSNRYGEIMDFIKKN